MNLSILKKYKLDEVNKINIYGNIIIDDVLKEISGKMKYINYFKSEIQNEEIIEYLFLILLLERNIDMFMDSISILNGNLLKNKYNNLLSEDNILLLFMKLKIFIVQKLNDLVYMEDFFQNIFDTKILKYENFLENDTLLLEKDLDPNIKNNLIKKELIKLKLSLHGFYLILSFYFYNYKINKDKKTFIEFIDNVENNTNSYIDNTDSYINNTNSYINNTNSYINNNLNGELDLFWKQLITSI